MFSLNSATLSLIFLAITATRCIGQQPAIGCYSDGPNNILVPFDCSPFIEQFCASISEAPIPGGDGDARLVGCFTSTPGLECNLVATNFGATAAVPGAANCSAALTPAAACHVGGFGQFSDDVFIYGIDTVFNDPLDGPCDVILG
ncbi:hypothetical protein FB45DRAFT_923943 [Roridomyces roridus]|uniref:Glycan binding protein Y3-like domain-containing protein n=1 Tax=Roridomyces roridus TaxID=1738132 RepID=A0AAD7BLF1_9AGAR|nr:hypothetical protein FB45DRAFT_923943 [Roridomyces roridus]